MVRSGVKVLALLLAGSLAAPGQTPDWDWFWGPELHLSQGLPVGNPSLGQDLHGHLGLGVGFTLGAAVTDRQAWRTTLEFTGQEVTTWYFVYPNWSDSIEYHDIWRSLRLGLEHQVALDARGRISLRWGGGVEEAWINRTEGSFLNLAGLGLAWSQGATEGSTRYSTKTTQLDEVHPFGTVGLCLAAPRGWRIDLRWIASRYLRHPTTGLTTQVDGAREQAWGHRVVLGASLLFGDL